MSNPVFERIKQDVTDNPVVLFMKGTAMFPQCGFSGRAIQLLKAAGASGVSTFNVLEDEDLFLHEAIPGHHFQVSLQQESTTLPDFRKFNWFGAYGEGWALYTESLGKELGLYQDPYQYLGMLNDEMHRAIRLVVDTGIHCKGWTREQAIAYSMQNEAGGEASITAEIERYMAIPGQALSYKIGQLKILELRHKADTQMGKQFDIKKFHEKVLESGVMPLALLESKMNAWMAAEK
jgi:uncharacterized protein (DUF885 family)